MASTYSTNLRIELMVDGENSNTWGDKTNTNLNLLEQAVSGVASVAMTDADYTLTTSNAATDEARNAVITMTGTLTQARNVIVPSVDKQYVVKNSTTGGFSIVVKTSGGTGITVQNGETEALYCDATNVLRAATTPTGTGAPVRATSPTLVTPLLGTPTSGTLTNCTGLPAAGVTGTAAILGANTFTGLQTLNAGLKIETGGIRGEVTLVRTAASTWSIVDENGVAINTAGTTTAGMQEAIDYATTNGLNIRVIGGGTSRTADFGVMNCTTGIVFPAVRDMSVYMQGVHVVFSAAVTGTGLFFDSCMQLDFQLVGEVTYQGTGAAVQIAPTAAIPVDTQTVVTGSRFYIGGVAATGGTPDALIDFDVSGGSIIGNTFEIGELVGSGSAGSPAVAAYGIKISGQSASTAFFSNIVDVANIHEVTTACVQEGVSATNQDQISCNLYRFAQLEPKGTNAQGWNGFGTNNQIQIGNIAPVATSSIDYGIYVQSGSTKNIFTVGKISASTAPINDNGTFNNFIYDGVSLIPLETKIAPTLAGTWSNLGAGQPAAKYWKDAFGFVHLEGAVTGGGADTITTLPAGYHPTTVYLFPVIANGVFGIVQIDTSGVVTCSVHTAVVLNGISFRV